MKKILIMTLLVFTLVGCGKDDNTDKSPNDNNAEEERIDAEKKQVQLILDSIGVDVLFSSAEFPVTEMKAEGYNYDEMKITMNEKTELEGFITVDGTKYIIEGNKIISE